MNDDSPKSEFLSTSTDQAKYRLESLRLRCAIDQSPAQVTSVANILTQRTERLEVTSFVPRPKQDEWIGLEQTDTSLLRQMTYATIARDIEAFGSAIGELLHNLQRRLEMFGMDEFHFPRVTAWSSVLANAAGIQYLANRHFLYRNGTIVPSSIETRSAMEDLLRGALEFLCQRSSLPISGPADWAQRHDADDARARRRLSNVANYIAREAYSLESSRPLPIAGAALREGNFDVLVQMASYPAIPFSRTDDPTYITMRRSIDELRHFIVDEWSSEDVSDRTGPWGDQGPASQLSRIFARASVNNGDPGMLIALQEDLGLDEECFTGLVGMAAPDRPATTIAPSVPLEVSPLATAVTRAVMHSQPSASLTQRFASAYLLHNQGDLRSARNLLTNESVVRQMSMAELYHYMRVIGLVLSGEELDGALLAVRRVLARLSRAKMHDVNLLARLLDFSNLAEDQRVMENANVAFDLLHGAAASSGKVSPGKTVLVLAILDCRVTPALIAPLAPILSQRGVEIRNLQANRLDNRTVRPWTLSPQLNSTSTAIVGDLRSPSSLYRTWYIDLAARQICSDNVNYYEGIYQRIARILKVFHVDWEIPAVRTWFSDSLLKVDRTIQALEGVREAAEAADLNIRMATLQSQYAPHSAIRSYCSAHGERIQHITLGSSYENWVTNVGGEPVHTLAMLNNTTTPEPSIPAFGTRAGFESWYADEFPGRRVEVEEQARRLFGMYRSGTPTAETELVRQSMFEDRRQNRKVFCLLGKIPYDLAVPYQGGPAHSDMADWLNHSVSIVSSGSHAIYVKPHPHERLLSISAQPIESFLDMLHNGDSERVTILPHLGVNLQSLLDVVDVFLCWNGSSIAELGAQGAKVIAADDWARRNYPIGVFLPDSRSHYEAILRGEVEVEMTEGFADRCRAFVVYLTKADFAIPYSLVERSSTNTVFNRATVRLDESLPERLETVRARGDDILGILGV